MQEEINIKSGELAFGTKGEILSTVLGSCIAVCIYDQELKIGGMNHYLLPRPCEENCSLQYGIYAIPALIKEFKKRGSLPKNLVAKIIGGATSPDSSSKVEVGSENIRLAREILNQFGIPIMVEEVGGNIGRQVKFHTSTGELFFKKTNAPTSNNSKIKVLIIDDSGPMRKVIRKMLEPDSTIEIIGEAADPFQAEEIRCRMRPDVITLDLHMPKKDGVSYLKEYMASDPIPTIIVTDYNIKDTGPVMDALEAGAFDYVQKPALSEIREAGEILNTKIKAAAKTKSSRLKQIGQKASKRLIEPAQFVVHSLSSPTVANSIIAIGASTGGTEAIKVVLTGLPKSIPPILIVQHMPPIFTKSFAERLNELCPFDVKEAEDNDMVKNGCVYIAPGGKQMAIVGKGSDLRICISDDPPENRFKPSVDFLFRSFAKISGRDRIAILLTGMGRDGACELLSLRSKGVRTIVQDENSSIVFGMPGEAIRLGAAELIRPIDEISETLLLMLKQVKIA